MDRSLILSREQVRLVDRLAVERYGMSGLVLMENAGRGAAEALVERAPELVVEDLATRFTSPPVAARGTTALRSGDFGSPVLGCSHLHQGEGSKPFVTILCGKGNNAGDGFVIARHLEIRGVAVKVVLLFAAEELRGDARVNFEVLAHTDVEIVSCEKMHAQLPATEELRQAAVNQF